MATGIEKLGGVLSFRGVPVQVPDSFRYCVPYRHQAVMVLSPGDTAWSSWHPARPPAPAPVCPPPAPPVAAPGRTLRTPGGVRFVIDEE